MATPYAPSLDFERHAANCDAEAAERRARVDGYARAFAAAVEHGDPDALIANPTIFKPLAVDKFAVAVAHYIDSDDLARVVVLAAAGKFEDAQRVARLMLSTAQQSYAELSAEV